MAGIGLSAFSIFFIGNPSFLAHQRALEEGHGQSSRETLFGMAAIPFDNYIRMMLDGASLVARQPIAAAIHEAGSNFILTSKPSSHQTTAEYLHSAEPQEHRQTVRKRGQRTTVYRWLSAVPLRATEDAIAVNWFSIEAFNAKAKRTYCSSFVTSSFGNAGVPRTKRETDLAITSDTLAELAACGRARWKACRREGEDRERDFQCAQDQRLQS
jgi:hypothetical protein